MKKIFSLSLVFLSLIASVGFAEAAKMVELKNGAMVEISGDTVMLIDQDGNKKPAPDGEHELANPSDPMGAKIAVKGGKLVK